MAAGGCWNSWPDCIFSLTNHIAIAFPPCLLLDTHNDVFRQHSAASNSVNPGSFSKWRPTKDVKYWQRTRLQISASEAFAKNFVTLFRDYFCHAYKLHTSQQQPSTRTGEFTMAAASRASGSSRAVPGTRVADAVREDRNSIAVISSRVHSANTSNITAWKQCHLVFWCHNL